MQDNVQQFFLAMKAVKFSATIEKFGTKGEKTGWTYVIIPADIAKKIKPGTKQSFRVKGKLDTFSIKGVALLPMGEGVFMMPLNATLRKGIGKRHGAMLQLNIEEDKSVYQLNAEFIECLNDEPDALTFFNSLTGSHQRYFSKWIESAKTDATKAKRIAQSITGFLMKQGFPEMLRWNKKNKL